MKIKRKFKSLVVYLLNRVAFLFSDVAFLKVKFWIIMGHRLDLDNPRTFNEKLQWLKIYNRKPIYSKMVDKIDAKEYVSNIIGDKYIIPTISTYDSVDDIDFNTLPRSFVLKCTHDSGKVIVCRDSAKLDVKQTKAKLRKALQCDYYNLYREWPYKFASRRIICEQLLEDSNQKIGLVDYKFYCFNGKPMFLYVSEGLENHSTAKISFLTMDWEFASFGRSDYRPFSSLPTKPRLFDEMVHIASKLSLGMPFIRVDLYEVGGRVYFSELTFTPCSGFMPFTPTEYDRILGDMIDLNIIT